MYSLSSQFANSQTLWIGDLETYMDEDFVRRLFGPDVQPYLHAVKLIKKEGRPAGYGFLDFTSRDAAQQVLTNYSGRPIAQAPGKVYRLNWASGHITGGTGQAAKQLAGNVGGDLFSVFVGDLSPEVTDYILLSSFQQRYSSVRGAKVIMDLNTGQSKGFGFVKFTDEQDMLRAMEEMNGQYVGSRPVKVAPASNSKRGGGGGMGGMGGSRDSSYNNNLGNGNYGNYGSNNGPNVNTYNQMPSHSPSPSPIGMSGSNRFDNSGANADPGNTTIYVGNLDPNTTDENVLRQTFSVYGPITYVKIPSNNRHCGFVQFAERSQAERAVMEMNGSRIQGNIVRVSWGKQQKKPHHHHQQQQQHQHHHHHQQQQHHHQQHHHQQSQPQHQMHMQHQGSGGMAPTTGYSVSPTPTAVIPQQQQQATAQQQQQQQQQYMAYLQWQQQMMAYAQQQQQQQQQSTAQQTNQQSTIDEDNLPSDYFTKGFDSQQENSKYIEMHEPIFTFSSIDLGHYMEDGVA